MVLREGNARNGGVPRFHGPGFGLLGLLLAAGFNQAICQTSPVTPVAPAPTQTTLPQTTPPPPPLDAPESSTTTATAPNKSSDQGADKNAAEMVSRDAPATFKAKVNLVPVPVVVRDRDGHTVGNLQKEDFQLYDRGKVQVISRFSVEKAGGKASRAAAVSEAPPGETRADKPEGEPGFAMPERFVAYVFDDIHLKFEDLSRARQAAQKHLADTLNPTDRVAIFTTSGVKPLDFTDDRGKLEAAMNAIEPRPTGGPPGQQCPDISYYMADLIVNRNDQQAITASALEVMVCQNLNPDVLPNAMQIAQQQAIQTARRVLIEGDRDSQISLSVLKQVVRRVSLMPGQRTVVLVSPGFLTPFQKSEESEVIESAIRFNVIINALNARGLATLTPDASEKSFDANATRMKFEYTRQSAAMEDDLLGELADGTGGTLVHNNNDLVDGLRRVDSAPEYYYLLEFSPQNLKYDGAFHRLKVTAKAPGGSGLQARRGYYAPRHVADPADESKQEIEEALFSREELHDLPIELHTQFFKASEDRAKLAVLAHVDLKRMRFRKEDDRNKNVLTIVSGLFDRNGNYIAGISKVLEMRLKDQTLEARQTSGITVKTSFDVKPGSYLVRLVVRDAEGQSISAENGAVEIP